MQLGQEHVEHIFSLTSREFYMDRDEAQRAVRLGRAFNLIHLASASKIDIFPMSQSEFHRSEMSRASEEDWVVPGEGGETTIRLPVASAEDTILSKLIWYTQGGQVSDRQWVGDLLERVFGEASQIDLS